jgi:hypothetical protein
MARRVGAAQVLACASVYSSTASRMKGSRRRRKVGSMSVTTQAPSERTHQRRHPPPAAAPAQRICTRRAYCTRGDAGAPDRGALVGAEQRGGRGGRVDRKQRRHQDQAAAANDGINTSPASSEASETISRSMRGLSHPDLL